MVQNHVSRGSYPGTINRKSGDGDGDGDGNVNGC